MMRKRENPHHRVWATRVVWSCAVHTILYDFRTTYKPAVVPTHRKSTIFLPLTNPTVVPT